MVLSVSTSTSGGKRLHRALNRGKTARGVRGVRVGFFESARYQDGTSVALVAAKNEFGTERIPERPYFRNANRKSRKPLTQLFFQRVDPQELVVDTVLAKHIGLMLQAGVQNEITRLRQPPNAPSTIARKGSENPLIDTGKMVNSVSFEVVP